jgi:DNA anti-recombination protein RmuC
MTREKPSSFFRSRSSKRMICFYYKSTQKTSSLFQIRRHEMKDHLDQNLQKHLDHACNKIRDMGADLRDKTFQLTQQSEKLTVLAAEQVRRG